MNTDTQSEKALKSSYFCYFLAFLVMCVTAWFIVEGIRATEPDSPARHAKVAAGVLLLVLEGCVFSLAGQYQKHAFILRLLGWSIFVLQIALMTLANYSVGATAGKAAALSTATVAEIREQSAAARASAKSLQEDAARLRTSKHEWKRDEAGKKSDTAAKALAAASGTVEKMEKLSISTPLVETIGTTGLMVLSGALAFILESAGIVLMHVAGSLRHKAQDGQQPVENQILGMLQQMTGAPASPALLAANTLVREEQRIAPATETPPFGFIPNNPKQARHDAPASGELWTAPRREYFLAPEQHPAKPDAEPASAPVAAPARPAEPVSAPSLDATHDAPLPASTSATTPISSGASKQTQPAPASASKQTHQATEGASKQTQLNDAAPKAKRSHKASTAVADGKKMDTGTGPHDGYRFRRVQAAIQAKTLVPGLRTIQRAEGGGAPTVRNYLAKMVETRVIKLNADGTYELIAADESQLVLEV